jgi:hypothetical protein
MITRNITLQLNNRTHVVQEVLYLAILAAEKVAYSLKRVPSRPERQAAGSWRAIATAFTP